MLHLRTVGPVVLWKKMFEYLFTSVDGQWMMDDAQRTHWYGNSSLWSFGPGEQKTGAKLFLDYIRHIVFLWL